MAAGSTYTPIATTTLGSAAASYTFSSIPSTYTDLLLVVAGTVSVNGENILTQYNGDTGSNYSFTYIYGTGSTAASGRQSNRSAANANYQTAFSSSEQSNVIVQVQNYSNSTTFKTALSRNNNANGSSLPGTEALVSLWRNTAAITSILVKAGSGNLNSGMSLTLYGIAAA
jgi:hypothetical protein